jgi:hypothetical protein
MISMRFVYLMWGKQCQIPAMTGNGKRTTFLWWFGGWFIFVLLCFTHFMIFEPKNQETSCFGAHCRIILDDPLWLGHREVPYREEPKLLDPWRMNLAEDCCPCPVCQRCQDETNSREYGAHAKAQKCGQWTKHFVSAPFFQELCRGCMLTPPKTSVQ